MFVIEIQVIPNDNDSDLWFKGLGWYFSTEDCDLRGPYDTEQVAITEQYSYAESLNADPCGYCGTSQNPNDICRICFDDLSNADDIYDGPTIGADGNRTQ